MTVSLTISESIMPVVKVSSKYQIVIPKEVREQSGLKPGDDVHVSFLGGVLRVVKVPTLEEVRGMLKGANLEFSRDKTDRAL